MAYSPLNGNEGSLPEAMDQSHDSLTHVRLSEDYDPLHPIASSIHHQDHEDSDAIKPIPRVTETASAEDLSQHLNDTSRRNESARVGTLGASREKTKVNAKPEWPLLYRRRTFWILFFYIPLLIIPWTLTCVLAVRPFNKPSYIIQWGGLSPEEILSIYGWLGAIKILNSIAGVLTIPIISTLLAQAAVVYCQRRKTPQSLSLRQVFALADRGWSDITILWGSWGSNQLGTSSRFLWLAALLILISAIQQPFQSGLVADELTTVMTCIDRPWYSCDPMHFQVAVAYDPEPGDMALLPQNMLVQEVAAQMATFNQMDVQPRMWVDHPYVDPDLIDAYSDPAWRQTFFWNFQESTVGPLSSSNISRNFFVTILENGTTTGVLREHATRFNSSVDCKLIPQSDFPQSCPGRRPFATSFSRPDYLDVRVCAPGEFGVNPWTTVRDRQDIEEQLFIDVTINPETVSADSLELSVTNFTVQCNAQTTRGYFEIGNYRNNYTYGPLVDKWPSDEEMVLEWNDCLNWYAEYRPPSRDDPSGDPLSLEWSMSSPPDPFETYGLNASGPLMTSVIAMFGNDSFFFVAANSSESTSPPALVQICQQDMIPFSRIGWPMFQSVQGDCSDIAFRQREGFDEGALTGLIWDWVANFQEPSYAQETLLAGMFLSNQAVLTITSGASQTMNARAIFTSPGLQLFKPVTTLAGKIIISTLIFLQLLGIGFVVRYIYKVPTWTPALDALAVARLARGLDTEDFPAVGAVSDKDREKLQKMDGLVGVLDADDVRTGEEDEVAASSEEPEPQPPFRLGLGAPGLIHRHLALPKKKKKRSVFGYFGKSERSPETSSV